jgi:hypothetical protein
MAAGVPLAIGNPAFIGFVGTGPIGGQNRLDHWRMLNICGLDRRTGNGIGTEPNDRISPL